MTDTPFKISLQNVPLRSGHILAKASAAQIVKNMSDSIKETGDEENDYQKILYPALRRNSKSIVEEFEKLCVYTSETDRCVRSANLFTPLSKTADAGPKFHTKTRLTNNTNFGPLLEALEQRVSYVLKKEVPKRYTENKEEGDAFNTLRDQLKTFSESLMNASEDYSTALTKARELVNMDEVAKHREEKRKERRAKLELRKKDNPVGKKNNKVPKVNKENVTKQNVSTSVASV